MRSLRLAAAAVPLLLLSTLAGCGGSSKQADDPGSASASTSTPTASASATPTPTPSPTTTASPTPTPTASQAAAGPPRCRTADLSFRVVGGDGGMGSDYSRIVMTNTGTQPCATGGYGGVSYVAKGAVVGAPAVRDRSVAARPIVLRPGQRASAQLQEAVAENYPAGRCRPVTVTSLRIYPPDETRSVDVRHSATGCAATGVQLLHLQAYRAG